MFTYNSSYPCQFILNVYRKFWEGGRGQVLIFQNNELVVLELIYSFRTQAQLFH